MGEAKRRRERERADRQRRQAEADRRAREWAWMERVASEDPGDRADRQAHGFTYDDDWRDETLLCRNGCGLPYPEVVAGKIRECPAEPRAVRWMREHLDDDLDLDAEQRDMLRRVYNGYIDPEKLAGYVRQDRPGVLGRYGAAKLAEMYDRVDEVSPDGLIHLRVDTTMPEGMIVFASPGTLPDGSPVTHVVVLHTDE